MHGFNWNEYKLVASNLYNRYGFCKTKFLFWKLGKLGKFPNVIITPKEKNVNGVKITTL